MRIALALILAGMCCGCATTEHESQPAVKVGRSAEDLEKAGYARSEARGTWRYGFERSEFVPVDAPKEKWWLKLPERWWDENRSSSLMRKGLEQDGVSVRVTGLLSPKGKFGHLRAYDREFVADTIQEDASR